MERTRNEVKCMYCNYRFVPDPVVTKNGKKRTTYIECPRCGNGVQRPFRWYDGRKVAANG